MAAYCGGRKPLFIAEDSTKAPQRAPLNDADFVECPCCMHSIPVSQVEEQTFKAGTKRRIRSLWPMITKENIEDNYENDLDDTINELIQDLDQSRTMEDITNETIKGLIKTLKQLKEYSKFLMEDIKIRD